ncbi:hypothetical protein Golomagni_05047 [Golovinomyces magnicellulatus]|nr:hypothetical protein Golomagni_05047 [Golovinomyces magnicellulatus]
MSKLFIGGLSWATDDQELRRRFEDIGPVEEATVVKDRETGRSRGFGFVRYRNEQDADKAISHMNSTEYFLRALERNKLSNNLSFNGRNIRVDRASERGQGGNAAGAGQDYGNNNGGGYKRDNGNGGKNYNNSGNEGGGNDYSAGNYGGYGNGNGGGGN